MQLLLSLDMIPDRALHDALLRELRTSCRPRNVADLAREVLQGRPLADRILVLRAGESYWERVCERVETSLLASPDVFLSEAPGAWALQGSSHSVDVWCAASDSPATELSDDRRDRLVDLLAGLTP